LFSYEGGMVSNFTGRSTAWFLCREWSIANSTVRNYSMSPEFLSYFIKILSK
jgi:hypothetical protein